MTRREYPIRLIVNGRRILKVVIDSHYEAKHGGSVNDRLIIDLVRQLSGYSFEPEAESGDYLYFVTDDMILGTKRYKLVWLLEKDELYLGVINAYRRR